MFCEFRRLADVAVGVRERAVIRFVMLVQRPPAAVVAAHDHRTVADCEVVEFPRRRPETNFDKSPAREKADCADNERFVAIHGSRSVPTPESPVKFDFSLQKNWGRTVWAETTRLPCIGAVTDYEKILRHISDHYCKVVFGPRVTAVK